MTTVKCELQVKVKLTPHQVADKLRAYLVGSDDIFKILNDMDRQPWIVDVISIDQAGIITATVPSCFGMKKSRTVAFCPEEVELKIKGTK